MCDERSQLPNAIPIFRVGVDVNRRSIVCRVVGYMGATQAGAPAAEFFDPSLAGQFASEFPISPAFTVPAEKLAHTKTVQTMTAMHRLADELSRLTMGMPDEQQKPVWETYYELHRIVTGGPQSKPDTQREQIAPCEECGRQVLLTREGTFVFHYPPDGHHKCPNSGQPAA